MCVRERERERKKIGESHRHVVRLRNHYIMKSREKQEVANFVSIFTFLSTLLNLSFAVDSFMLLSGTHLSEGH